MTSDMVRVEIVRATGVPAVLLSVIAAVEVDNLMLALLIAALGFILTTLIWSIRGFNRHMQDGNIHVMVKQKLIDEEVCKIKHHGIDEKLERIEKKLDDMSN